MAKKTREVAIYIRVSKVGEREGKENFYSVEQQEEGVRAEIARVKWTAGKVFTDLNVSGGGTDRPGLNAAVAWVREYPSRRAIGVYAADRWGRDMASSLTLLKKLYAEDAEVLFPGLSIDTENATGTMIIEMMLMAASLQRNMIGKRWKDTAASRVAKSLPSGGPIRYGYRLPPGERSKNPTLEELTMQPDPVTGPILASMYHDYIAGKGVQAIARDLNAAGHTTTRGNVWNASGVQRTLDSGFGAGLLRLVSKGEDLGTKTVTRVDGTPYTFDVKADKFVPGLHKPVISEDDWLRYRQLREQRRTSSPTETRHRPARWWLAGVARCGVCGERLMVNSYSAKKSQAICGAYKASRTCTGVWINRTYLESVVGLWLAGRVDELAAGAAGRIESTKQRAIKADAAVRAAAERVEELSTEQADFVRKNLSLDADVLRRLTDQMSAELQVAKNELDAAKVARADVGNEPGPDLYERLLEGVKDANPAQWNSIVRRVIESVVVTKELITITAVEASDEPAVYVRKNPPRHRNDMTRGDDGKFIGKAKS